MKTFFNEPFFLNATSQDLDYNKSLYTNQFLKKLKEILPEAKIFYKLPRKKQREINKKIQELFLIERNFKSMVQLNMFNALQISELLKEDYQKFNTKFKQIIRPSGPKLGGKDFLLKSV